jgi:hypothetical protein
VAPGPDGPRLGAERPCPGRNLHPDASAGHRQPGRRRGPLILDGRGLRLVSLAGFALGVLAIWSAIKAWLRDDALSVPARWGAALGLAAMLLVAAIGPCGPQSCPR